MSVLVPPTECWLWLAGDNGRYGTFRASGRKNIYAHRFALDRREPMPSPGLHALHKCNVPLCINPDHLYWGTRKDNERDKREAGNVLIGERHNMVKLTEESVREIRDRADVSGVSFARKYGVSPQCVYAVRNRISWTHLTP